MLENEIKNLTVAIQLLTDAVNKNHLVAQAEIQAPVAEPAPVVEINTPSVSIDILQSRCLELTRIDRDNNPKIKAIISSYGAALLKDVPADKLADLAAKLEELA
jgi:hypothetical protein